MNDDVRLGLIEVSPSAVASIASKATLQCYGVVGMAAATLRDGLAELLSGERRRRGIEVTLNDRRIVIDIYVILEFGVRISDVAQNIMESVGFTVQKALGISVCEVNVYVQGLRISQPG